MQNVCIPDLLCCYCGVFIGIEIKRPGKKPTPAQVLMMKQIRDSGGIAGVATDFAEADKIVKKAVQDFGL